MAELRPRVENGEILLDFVYEICDIFAGNSISWSPKCKQMQFFMVLLTFKLRVGTFATQKIKVGANLGLFTIRVQNLKENVTFSVEIILLLIDFSQKKTDFLS